MAEKKLMYNEKEIELLKRTFAENETLLLLVRKLFLGFDLSDDEKEIIKSSFTPEVIEVFRKKVYGIQNIDTPIGQLTDFWLGAEQQVFGQTKDTIYQAIQSKAKILDMFETAFKLLENPDGEKVNTSFDPKNYLMDELGINLIARNLYIKAIETALSVVQLIAGQKTESVEATMKRLQQDSAK